MAKGANSSAILDIGRVERYLNGCSRDLVDGGRGEGVRREFGALKVFSPGRKEKERKKNSARRSGTGDVLVSELRRVQKRSFERLVSS